MSERPFMQLYVSDFLGDTLSLSTEQIGAYLLLLMAMWNAKGSLPDDDAKLARIARMSIKKWRAIARELMAYFDRADGQVTHHRLTFELQKSERQSESRAAAGARGGMANALKNHKPGLASAVAKRVAGPQHLPEPYRKEGAIALDPTDGTVRLARYTDTDLFKACEKLTAPVPAYLSASRWPADIVAKARAELETATPSTPTPQGKEAA